MVKIPSDYEIGQSVTYKGITGQITRIRGRFMVTVTTGEAELELEVTPDDVAAFWVQEQHLTNGF